MFNYNFGKIASEIEKGSEVNLSLFNHILNSKTRLKAIRHTQIKANSLMSLLTSLIRINQSKLSLTIFMFVMQLSITILSPFLTSYLIDNYLLDGSGSLVVLLFIFLAYKLLKNIAGIICDFCYQSLGYEYFARLYWHILTTHIRITGKMLNLIEYDCNLISNLPYAALTAFFYIVEMLVILGLFTYYLSSTSSFSIFVVVIVLYLCSQTLVNFFTFQFTKKYLLEKDRRLNYNITNDLSAGMTNQRNQELDYNRKFLYSKILSKFVTIFYPMLINLYVFVFADRSTIKNVEYILLILINMIRNPITQLLLTLNLMVQISNSCQRIVNFNPIEEPITQDIVNQELKDEQQSILPFKIKNGDSLNQQKGIIKLKSIIEFCSDKKRTLGAFWICVIVLGMMMVAGNFYNYKIAKHIISQTYTTLDFISLGYQLIVPLLFYYLLIVSTQKISRSLFSGLQKSSLSCQFLNRISGDITAIDRSIVININETFSSFAFIISSYLYSIFSLKNLAVQATLVIFLIICLIASFNANRYIMRSRREVARKECLLKGNIIKSLMKKSNIRQKKSMKKAWRNIFQCKQMGLFIQNYFMVILNLILLAFSLVLIGSSNLLDISEIDRSILLIACLNVDFDMLHMFLSAVRLEISLVSFERVINAIKPQE